MTKGSDPPKTSLEVIVKVALVDNRLWSVNGSGHTPAPSNDASGDDEI